MTQTPTQGLSILEDCHQKNPNNQTVLKALIDAYIKLGVHDKAVKLIQAQPVKTDITSLRHRAFVALMSGDKAAEKQLWRDIVAKQYTSAIDYHDFDLIKRSHQDIKFNEDDIPLFCIVNNEQERLPFFLAYYRALGISQFVFIDHNSSDETLALLLAQDDCHVFWTNDDFSEAAAGVPWIRHLVRSYLPANQWCIHADIDEFLVYPNCETVKLPSLIRYLEGYDFECMSCFMLDMFPKDVKAQLAIQAGDNLLHKSPYFYNHYQFKQQVECPYINPIGGIFALFGVKFWWTKTALFKPNADFMFLSATHASTPMAVADVGGAYLHFKMIGDFAAKAANEQHRKQHWAGGIHYRQYANMYQSFDEDFDFTSLDKTVKYQNSQQLVQLGLIKTSLEWENYCTQYHNQ